MRTVTVARFVPVGPAQVERALSPAAIVEYEGSFRVEDVTESGEDVVVTAAARGLELRLRFERTEDGYRYEQEAGGPLDAMETELTWTARDHGTELTFTSSVSAGLPFASLTDRVAAWKRRGELKRALGNLEADLS